MGFERPLTPTDWSLSTTRPPYDADERQRWAQSLGVTCKAVEILLESDVIDLHIDSFIWTRLFGYDLCQWHDRGPLGARYLRQADLPRLEAASIDGALWILTTNPFRSARNRLRALVKNFEVLSAELYRPEANAKIVRTYAEYVAARGTGHHAAFLGIQGANALSDEASASVFPLERLLLVTLMHLTDSDLGHSSSPLRFGERHGLSPRGRALIFELESRGVWLDLAHASKATFWDAVTAHDPSRPLIVSHTGFSGMTPHWRNLDDEQGRAIVESGGLLGVLFHSSFLGDPALGGSVSSIARHLKYGLERFGVESICLGSDWDGMIATPFDMPTCLELPRLVQALIDEGVNEANIRAILGGNFLRVLRQTRP